MSHKKDYFMPYLIKLQKSFKKRGVKKTFNKICDKATKPLRFKLGEIDYLLKRHKTTVESDLPYDPQKVVWQFKETNIPVHQYPINKTDFSAWLTQYKKYYPQSYIESYQHRFVEKALEHYLSLQFFSSQPDLNIIDVANAGSPFPQILKYGYGLKKIISNDLIFKPGIREVEKGIFELGGNAAHTPFKNNSLDVMILHCALELFEGEDDINLIKEANRLLKKGGKLLIVPLYMNGLHHIVRDPASDILGGKIDPGARLIYRKNFHHVRFARFYSVEAFQTRLLKYAQNLRPHIYYLPNEKEISPACYVKFIAVFTKDSTD